MAALTAEQRLDRLERVVHVIAEDQVSLQKLIAELAKETRKGFELFEKRFAAVERRMDAAERRMEKTERRADKLDERVDKLVSAMGEFIRQRS
ncbi:MAG: hypothetical protein FJW38_20400 [Acidobacteria bacterium]|nr:hypothetical protein [Acidobacteriota bacterium]